MIECTYFYPMKHKEGVEQWVIGHCGFRFINWRMTVADCAFVRGKDGKPPFIAAAQKRYKDKNGKMVYVWFWYLEDKEMAEEFQIKGKQAIYKFLKERDMDIPKELSEFSK